MEDQPILSLNELSDKFFVTIEEKFRDMFFEKARSILRDWTSVAKFLNLNTSSLFSIRKSQEFIDLNNLRKLSKLTNINMCVIEKQIIATKFGGRGNPIFISWPIIYSSDLSSLVGHGISDGSISSKDKYRYRYCGDKEELRLDVQTSMWRTFGIKKAKATQKTKFVFEDKYSPIAGYILNKVGVPEGDKVKQPFDVPTWIKNGNKEIKRRFIQSIFDDEGTVPNYGIKLDYSKLLKLKKHHIKFLNSIRSLLKEFDIDSKILTKYIYNVKKDNEKRIGMQIYISGKKNLIKFSKDIRFLHPKKMMKLENFLIAYTRRRYSDGGKAKEEMYEAIKSGKNTIRILKRHFKKADGTIRHHIYNLEKDGLVRRKDVDVNKAIIWKALD